MANEAVIKIEAIRTYDFTVADGTGIEKGTILRLIQNRTAIASSGTSEVFAGIAKREKIASDGRTSIAVATDGVYDLVLATNSTCQAGDLMVISGANLIAAAATFPSGTDAFGNTVAGVVRAMVSGMIVGKALETGASGATVEVDVGVKG